MRFRVIAGIILILLLIGVLTLTFNLQPAKSEPTTWTVDDNGPADFHTIRAAMNSPLVKDGDTILVKPGKYYQSVVVNKAVSLIGAGKTKTAIINDGNYSAICICTDNVTVSGFEIQNVSWESWGIFLNLSSNSNIERNLVKATHAILVEGGSGNNISGNEVSSLDDSCVFSGLRIEYSSNNVVTGNYLSDDCHNAITLFNSDSNNVTFNYISGHFSPCPFSIQSSNNNSIIGNTILPKAMGYAGHIVFTQSNSNVIYHNNFLRDGHIWISIVINDDSINNVWDNGYYSGGNYWFNYSGTDFYSGPYQNETGSDGIGDISYIIDEDNTDTYPLMYPYGYVPDPDINDDGIIDIVDIVTVALAFGSKHGDPDWNPYVDLNQDGIVDIVDLVTIAIHFGETW